MEIAMIIVGGLVLMTIFASGFDYLSKRRKGVDNVVKLKVEELENRVRLLEQNLGTGTKRWRSSSPISFSEQTAGKEIMEPVRMSMAPCGINSSSATVPAGEKPVRRMPHRREQTQLCRNCVIRDCPEKGGDAAKLYVTCEKYPCKRMKDLPNATGPGTGGYRSEHEDDRGIGFEAFCAAEKERWTCRGAGIFSACTIQATRSAERRTGST
jgi:hypothetical protein